jgi:phthalate 4,5-cis-dihydrodiol dehydrogenase
LTIGLGVVGLGTAGAAMLGAAFGHSAVTVTAIADADSAWLEACADGRGGEPRRYDSLDRLLQDDRVEAVHIATPTPLHFQHVLTALRAGRHVIVEKPVTATLGEAEELAARAAAFDRVVIVGHSEAFEPYVQAVRSVIDAGAIGAPVMVLAEKFTDWMRRPRLPQEWDGAAGGGLIRRQGVHQIDVVRTVTGASYSVREARIRVDTGRGIPGSYFAWLTSDQGTDACITHDGVGRLSPAAEGARATGHSADGADLADEAAKRSRRQALLRQVLQTRSPPRLGDADTERLLVFGTDGDIVASARQVSVSSGAGRTTIDLSAFAAGRHAVLDELAAGISGARAVVHDLSWGCQSLRTCADIERAARTAHSVLSGSRSALIHNRLRLATSFSKGMVSPTA